MADPAQATTPDATAPAPLAVPSPAPDAPAIRSAARLVLGLTPRQLGGLCTVMVAANLPLLHYLVRGEAAVTAALPFADDFNRAEIGSSYSSTGGHWRIESGVLHAPGVKNNPLWLKARLPERVSVEFDVRSESTDGDIKCEIFGNGRDHSSGYVIIFGGWSNSTSVISRLDEHGLDRKENRSLRVEKGRTYRFRVERTGTLLRWYADDKLMMEYDDPAPLHGSGNDRFGFSTWEADVFFDNLAVKPL
jgi:hypothetical protein